MADTISYKVQYLGGDESEVRRFCLDKDVSFSFTYLEEKLCHVFPQLRRQTFSIHWTDEEGDIVTVVNDEDLMIALTEMKGSLYKFIIKKSTQGKAGKKTETSGSVHYGVKCDKCQGNVVGFRYKCLVCEDFDLCADCEVVGSHSEHNMIRISNPQDIWPQHVFSPLRILNQYQETSKEEEMIRNKKTNANKCKHGKPTHPFSYAPTIETLLGPTFEMMIKALAGQHKAEQKTEKPNSKCQNRQANVFFDNVTGKAFEKLTESIIENSKNIENMGKVVSDLLQPLGMNVSFKVKQTDDKDSTKDQKIEPEKEKNEKEEEQEPGKENIEHEKAMVELLENKVEPEKEKLSGYQSPPLSDDGDWNVVDNNIEEITETNQELPKVFYGSVDGNLYPTLPEKGTPETKITEEIAPIPSTSSASEESTVNPSVIAEHSDPKVQVALQAMINMGFTNDGGWLTNLLEAKQGDIGKTLDVLQPSNRN